MSHFLIGGQWRQAQRFHRVINPARINEAVGESGVADPQDVDDAVSAASDALPGWSSCTARDRASAISSCVVALETEVARIARWLTLENGKPLRESLREVQRSVDLLRMASTDLEQWWEPRTLDTAQGVEQRRRARGVTAVISPRNSPVLLTIRRVAPAVATGNTVVIKPASSAPLAIRAFIDVCAPFFPPGVLNFLTGEGQTAGTRLVSDPRVRMVGFTGSTETGRHLATIAAQGLKKMSMELGGNDPAIVLEDAVLDDGALARMTGAILRGSGQVCIAIKRIYVHRSRLDELVAKLRASFDRTVVGDGLREETTMGPLGTAAQYDVVTRLIRETRAQAASVIECGQVLDPEAWPGGYFVRPSIVLGSGPEADIVTCEQFGPVVPVIPFDSVDDAIRLANDTVYGLRASVWTADRPAAIRIAGRLEAGAVFYNAHGIFDDLHFEFPGIKQSGVSRESIVGGLDVYADTWGFAG